MSGSGTQTNDGLLSSLSLAKTPGNAKHNPLKEVIKAELRSSAGIPMNLARFMELGL